jgi:hypothetical protein
MDVDDQIGVRGATTTLLTVKTSEPHPLPYPPYTPP